MLRVSRVAVIVLCLCMGNACRQQAAPPPARDVVVWREVGSWSGHGNFQSQNFTSDTGGFRVRWQTKNETTPGSGALKAVFRSGDCGPSLMAPVPLRGAGK